jgi:hypothetical protein
MSKSTES